MNIKHLISILFALFLITACTDDSGTTISITVKNNASVVQPDVVVYEFENPITSVYGCSPNYANKLSVTDKNGVAKFNVDGFEYDNSSEKTTLYFTVLKEINDTTFDPLGTVAVSFKKGDKATGTLIVN